MKTRHASTRLPLTRPLPNPDEERPTQAVEVGRDVPAEEVMQSLLKLITPRLPSSAVLQSVAADGPQSRLLAAADRHRAAAQRLLDSSVADNTRRSYASHVKAWATWCQEHGLEPLAADPQDVALFLTAYAVEVAEDAEDNAPLVARRSTSAIQVRAAALAKIHRNAGMPSPTEDPVIRELLAGVRKTFHVRPRHAKGAADRAMLGALLDVTLVPTPADTRRWALILLSARTRLSVGQTRRLRWADIDITQEGVAFALNTDAGGPLHVPRSANPQLCLATALEQARMVAPHLGQVFVGHTGQPLSRQAMHQTLSTCENLLGVPLGSARSAALSRAWRATGVAGRGRAVRNRALLTVGWWAALRRSEISSARWGHLTRRPDGSWALLIPSSKTDQEGHGYTVYLPRLPHDVPECPARALDAWRAHLTELTGMDPLGGQRDSAVFARLDNAGWPCATGAGRHSALSGHGINLLIQDLAQRAGRDVRDADGRSLWGAHSLRAGFVTEALRDRKLSVEEVQTITRHRSLDVLIRYRREIQGFGNSPVHTLISAMDLAV